MPNQDLTGDDSRNKSLGEVAELVVVVSLPAEEIADEFKRLDLGVGIMRAEKKNQAMTKYKPAALAGSACRFRRG
jgi:hypothetical protein